MVYVVLELMPGCPRCKTLRDMLEPVLRKLNVPFIVEHIVDARRMPDSYTRTIEMLDEETKGKLKAIGLWDVIARSKRAPNLRIHFYVNGQPREIVISGWSVEEDEDAKKALENIVTLIAMAKRVEDREHMIFHTPHKVIKK